MLLNYAFSTKLKHSNDYNEYKDISIFRSLYLLDADPFLVDRTGSVSFPFSENCYFPMIQPSSTVLSWEECSKNRVIDLLSKHENVYVMWSGGIDSTLMLLSFMKYGNMDKVTIVLNIDSIKEYGYFYKRYIANSTFKVLATEQLMRDASLKQLPGPIISAEHADQLVGSPMAQLMSDTCGRTMLGLPFDEDNFSKFLDNLNIPTHHIDTIMEIYNITIKKSPRPIKNMWDLCWWHGFNFKWQTIYMKLAIRIKYPLDIITFFSSEDFQNTSIHQEGNTLDLKQVFKDVIVDFTLDNDYLEKEKFASSTLYYGLSSPAGLDSNWNKIADKEFNIINYYNKNNTIKELINA